MIPRHVIPLLAASIAAVGSVEAAPKVSRLTPPSGLFSFGDPKPPIISRFLPGQRFDLQATVQPDAGQTITKIEFMLDNVVVNGTVSLTPATVSGLPAGTTVGTMRAFSASSVGAHLIAVRATQSDGTMTVAEGNFEIYDLGAIAGQRAKNVIVLIGDGMGIAHRSAARIMLNGVSQGKVLAPLAMDQFPITGIVHTHSLNSIVTDSAPGASCYSTGNKNNNNQEGVFPDDTTAKFDNPRTEYLGEYLARTKGKSLGIVTTADVFDATPAAWAVHTQDRGAGTGICDQFLDEAVSNANLSVLLGGGRKWFLPAGTIGSARADSSDYVLPEELAKGWNVSAGKLDSKRDLIADFQAAGFSYVANATQMKALSGGTNKLLGLFAYSNMNVALDKINGRRGNKTVVDDYGFPDQPMLDEMTDKALQVLEKNNNGFVLMVEGASIDKQAHNMDSERWMLETIEFDRAVEKVRQYILSHPDTLAIVTADHECAGVNIIGASTLTATAHKKAAEAGGVTNLRDNLVGNYDAAGFPYYEILSDGYPASTDVDRKILIGYAANSDRYEDWLTNSQPLRDSQQPLNGSAPLNAYPSDPTKRDTAGGFMVTGQVPGSSAVHTASDIPLSAMGAGSSLFVGVMDNTDVFFKSAQAVLRGAGSTLETPRVGQRTATDRLINISNRGFVGTGDQAMLTGFVISGSLQRTLLIRAIGGSLAKFGMKNVLSDPRFRILDNAGHVLYSNDNWDAASSSLASTTAQVGAFPLDQGSKDAALVVSLLPGNYVIEVTGEGGGTGVALTEVYETL